MKRFVFAFLFLFGVFLLALGPHRLSADSAPDSRAPVLVLGMTGAVGPAFSEFLAAGLAEAQRIGAQLVLIELNTPGGLLTSTREMASAIVESPVPVAVYVTPSGGHAASAGTFLVYAAHIAAMDESTNIGAATPIDLGGTRFPPDQDRKSREKDSEEKHAAPPSGSPDSGEAMDRKALEDTAAFIRGLAEMRGRNAQWAEEAVTQARSLTSREALDQNVIDFLAPSRADLLRTLDGHAVTLKNGTGIVLRTQGAPVIEKTPDLRMRFLSLIADPNIAFLLMTIGMYGLILEFYNPGTLIPGTIGAICLIMGLFALNVLPVNIAGVILLCLGAVFMFAEAFVPSFGVLGIAGFIAFFIGAMIMFDMDAMPGMGLDAGVVLGAGLAGLLVTGLIVLLGVRAYRHKTTTGTESMIGHIAKIVEWDGRRGRVRVQGEIWAAFSSESYTFTEDQDVLICAIKDLDVKIRPV